MKAKLYDQIKTLVEVQAGFSNEVISKGMLGTIVECYEHPEGYDVDLAIPNEKLVGGFRYENVIFHPNQFTIVSSTLKTSSSMAQ